jgi:hypothetical protein
MTSSPLRFGFAFLAFALVSAAFALPAVAGPDAEGSITITSATCEDIGLGGLCSGPLYVVTKTFQVFAGNNPDNPVPVAGNFTYVYTIANSPSSVAIFGAINELNVQTPPNGTTSYGFIDGAGVEPSSTAVATGDIRWRFDSPNINPGETSEQLYLISPFGPGEVDDTVIGVGNVFSIDTQATCVGPVVAPPALACTIGFWKNREDGKKGLLKFFEGADFDAVKAEAVSISTVFSTEAELVDALTSKGNRSIEERAKQQLAALLLNVAAGKLFPNNTKCRLFLDFGTNNGTEIDLNGDGTADTTVEAALTTVESNILSGDPALQEEAKDLADDINNGVGVINSTMFN